MRIVIDFQCIQTASKYRGIGHYSRSLVREIFNLSKDDEIIILLSGNAMTNFNDVYDDIKSFCPITNIRAFLSLEDIAEVNPKNLPRVLVSEDIRNELIDNLEPDFVLVTSLVEGGISDYVCSINNVRNYKVGVIGYDLIPLKNNEFSSSKAISDWYERKITQFNRADYIFAISEYVKQDFINELKIDESKIINISSACSSEYKVIDRNIVSEILSDLSIDSEFILYCGAADKRKNLIRLLEAYSSINSELRDKYKLVLVGKYFDSEKTQLLKRIKELGINSENIVFPGYISNQVLACLYNACKVFVFPSLEEGFGLPVLEAMSSGAPVICSNTSSLPEVISLEEAMFDPLSVSSITNVLEKSLTDEVFRAKLRKNALEQASKFSWTGSARRLLQFVSPIDGKEKINKTREALFEKVAKIYLEFEQDDLFLKEVAVCLEKNEKLWAKKVPIKIYNWRIEGPFDSSYSLAIVNREFARAINELYQEVSLHSMDGPGDFEPNPEFLNSNPDIAKFYEKGLQLDSNKVDILTRDIYPPRVEDMDGLFNSLHVYAWEESGYPQDWVNKFNIHLNGMTCISSHTTKILKNSGFYRPLANIGCGVDHWERINVDDRYKLSSDKGFKFLHVSSCFPRKGVEELLDAYGQTFTAEDDVTLVIKTFENPHNQIEKWLCNAKAKYSAYPEVELINKDLPDDKLKSLYFQCDVLVAPSKAEGFGLPLAEAMLSGLPVITTNWGGQLDFCNGSNSWLVDYKFERADTHFNIFNSVWAQPDIKSLSDSMRKAVLTSEFDRKKMAQVGRDGLLERFKWTDVAFRAYEAINGWMTVDSEIQGKKVGWISSWRTKCGIAMYSQNLVQHMVNYPVILASRSIEIASPERGVYRCWENENTDFSEVSSIIKEQGLDVLVIQFNYGFFEFEAFSRFLKEQVNFGIKIVLMMHSTIDPTHVESKNLSDIKDSLAVCEQILVHSPDDLNRLKAIGLVENVALFPHGLAQVDFEPQLKPKKESFLISSYGFFLPHKGLLELITSISMLREKGMNVELQMVNAEYPVEESSKLITEAKELIESLGLEDFVVMNTNYLENSESLSLLSRSDLIVCPYQETGESSSAAVRTALTSGKSVAVTPLAIFEDVEPAVFKMKGTTPLEISESIEELISELENRSSYVVEKESFKASWLSEHDVRGLALRLSNMLAAV